MTIYGRDITDWIEASDRALKDWDRVATFGCD